MAARDILVLGGSGFVGTRLCAELARRGDRLTVPTRDPARARHLSVMPALKLVGADVHDPTQLSALCAGRDAVVNLVGILNEPGRNGSGFRHAHADLARRLVAACRAGRVPRLLQVSALRADADRGPSHYLRSKGQAERIIRDESGPDLGWTILQPSVIFGPGDDFVNRFARLLRLMPLVFPLARPGARFAPVWVGDVVAALVRCLDDASTAGECYQLCGPERLSLREIVTRVRDELGYPHWIIGLPDWAARLQAATMDFFPGKPFSSDNYRSLTVDSICTENGLARLGIRPQPMDAIVPQYLGLRGPSADRLRWRQRARR